MFLELGPSAIVCLVGVITYALSTNAKIVEIGRIMFAFGLLATLLAAREWFRLHP